MLCVLLVMLARPAAACDVERGARIFDKCALCHTRDVGAAHGVGPNLAGIIGRRAGSAPEYTYSAALRARDLVWTTEQVAAFLADPAGWLPGTTMAFAGLPKAADREAVACWLAQAQDATGPAADKIRSNLEVSPVKNATPRLAPISITAATRTREGLLPIDPWPREMVIEGAESHAIRDLYKGEFVVQVYEGADGIVKVTDYPYDEFVCVLHGEAILTPDGGEPQRFVPGDYFIVPRGFTGTWEGRNGFRELILMETKSHTAAWGEMLQSSGPSE